MYGTAVMASIPHALKEAAAELCPNVEVRLLDGQDLDLGALARAASDMALSLVDCLQETFGLTPVEAMASGLPAVVSDWNGYRDTVVEGCWQPHFPIHSNLDGVASICSNCRLST